MEEYIKTFLEKIGEFCIVLLFLKGIIEKYIYTKIEKISDIALEKAKNKFAKNLSAFEILLRKEFDYYEAIDKINAQIIVDIQDIKYYSDKDSNLDKNEKLEKIKEISLGIFEAVKDLKNYNLIYQLYVPNDIFTTTAKNVIVLQDNAAQIKEVIFNIYEDKESDMEKISQMVDDVLKTCALTNSLIKNRLDNLAK